MHVERAVLTGFNAPAATVTLVFVNDNIACDGGLGEGVAGACGDACGVLADLTGYGYVLNLILTYNAYTRFGSVVYFFFVV